MTVESLPRLMQSTAPLREKIISALRSAIETGELAAGARLGERDLCEQLSISRTSFREAIRELVAEGVITQRGRDGLVVAEVTLAEARAAYSLRAVIQALIVDQFIERASEDALALLENATQRLMQAYRLGDVKAILLAKRGFYAELCAGADNAMAQDMIERLCLRVSGLRSRALGRRERNALSIEEIGLIVSAISRRDREAAKQAVADHIDSVARWALSMATPEPDDGRLIVGQGGEGAAGMTATA